MKRTTVATVAAVAMALAGCVASGPASSSTPEPSAPAAPSPTSSTPTASATPTGKPRPPSDQTVMSQVGLITGDIAPKSVVANGRGQVMANNMMYRHTMTFYDAASRELIATLPDQVDMAEFGFEGHPGLSQGAPVESAFTADGRTAYVSNYTMYGTGYGPSGLDDCYDPSVVANSYLYEVDVATHTITDVIEVGATPKYVAITPDQKTMLVSNWCSFDVSIIDMATKTETARVPIGRWPRGIAISADSATAYVTSMGENFIKKVDIAKAKATMFARPGERTRHLVMSPDGAWLYCASSGLPGRRDVTTVTKINPRTGTIVATMYPGPEPRTMDISPDGRALYVTNYDAFLMTKISTSTMEILQQVTTGVSPVGLTYEPTTGTVWVANYQGSIQVFDDTQPAG